MTESPWGASFGTASLSTMQVYEDVLVPRVFTPWARVLLDELDLRPGEAVLDVACGPGSATHLAASRVGPSGLVTGCDLSPAMLTIAQRKRGVAGSAPITYHEAPADRLPVANDSFDVVICQQGLQFFPDRPAALREMRRALRLGGRLGVAAWSEIAESPLFAALEAAIRDVAGDEIADRYRGGPWGMTSADEIRTLLEQAGFSAVRVLHRSLPVSFKGGPAQLVSTLAASGVAADLDALPSGYKDRLGKAFEQKVAHTSADGELRSELTSHLAFARR